mmetsp:Transcript_96399/g.144278  ORF Transcript_96399/g.144278 Transcript_96399/m.144278 type:complete len:113 (-) Transcript_96399:51-389(-)
MVSQIILTEKINKILTELYFSLKNSENFFDHLQITTRLLPSFSSLENPWKERKCGKEVLKKIGKITEIIQLWKISPIRREGQKLIKSKAQMIKIRKNLKRFLEKNFKKKKLT